MIILSTLFLLISNAVSLRRDMAILYNRIAIIALLYAILQSLIMLSVTSNGVISIHEIGLHVTNMTQVFYCFYLLLLFLNIICILLYKDISMSSPAGLPLIFGILFYIKEKTIKFYIKNKTFFVVKNYCFIQLGITRLSILLYMFVYITTVFLFIIFYNGSIGIVIDFFYFSTVELLTFFLCIFILFIGFLSKGVSPMIDFIYNYINTLINIILILGVILIYLYLIFDINLNVVFYSLLYFRYFRFTMFILISLFMIYTLNIKSLFDILLIFSLSYLIYKFTSFLGLVLFINLINDFNLIFTTGSLNFGSGNKDIINFNLLDNLSDKGAKALLENSLYFSKEANEYINSIPETGNKSFFHNLSFSVFNLLFNITNNKTIYIPSAFKTSSLPIIINVKLGIINESPILTQVLNCNLKILGGASIVGAESSVPNLMPEPLLVTRRFESGTLGHWLFIENLAKMPHYINNYNWPDNLTNIRVTTDQKFVFDYLLSTLEEKPSNFVCFKPNPDNTTLSIFNYSDIYVNNRDKVSLFFKVPRSSPDVIITEFTMLEDIAIYMDNNTVGTNSEFFWIVGELDYLGQDGKIKKEYIAYIHIKDQDIFNIDTIIEKSINNFSICNNSRSYYNPYYSIHSEKPLYIHDHFTTSVHKRRHLPFLSPPKLKIISDTQITIKETNIVTKKLYYYLDHKDRICRNFINYIQL